MRCQYKHIHTFSEIVIFFVFLTARLIRPVNPKSKWGFCDLSSEAVESQNYLHPVASPASRITSANFLPAPCSKSPWKIQIFVLTSMRILHECETTDPTELQVENEVEMHMSYSLPHGFPYIVFHAQNVFTLTWDVSVRKSLIRIPPTYHARPWYRALSNDFCRAVAST